MWQKALSGIYTAAKRVSAPDHGTVALRVDRGVAFGCTKMAGIPTIQKTLVTDGWLVGGLSVVFGWRVGMVWALWDDVHAAENF